MPNEAPVLFFWTGGWDSTYRLLDLLLIHRRKVRPLYFIDENRASLAIELATIREQTARITALDPDAAALLLPLETRPWLLPPPEGDIWSRAWQTLRADRPVGAQYAHLARTLAALGLRDVELCIEVNSTPERMMRHRARSVFLVPGLATHQLPPPEGTPDAIDIIFGGFTFPLFTTTKKQMENRSRELGWMSIMEQTWYCHSPARGGVPCGYCVPCNGLYLTGLQWRLPVASRLRHFWHRGFKSRHPIAYQKINYTGRICARITKAVARRIPAARA